MWNNLQVVGWHKWKETSPMVIQKIDILNLYLLSEGENHPLFEYYLRHPMPEDCVLAIFMNEKAIGFFIVNALNKLENAVCRCVWLKQAYRNKGLLSSVFFALKTYAKQQGCKGIDVKIPLQAPYFLNIESALLENGFVQADSVHVLAYCEVSEESKKIFEEIYERYIQRVEKRSVRQGYSLLCWRELAQEQRTLLIDDNTNGFGQDFHLRPLLQGAKGEFLEDYSYFVLRDGLVVALTIVLKTDEHSAVFWLIAVHEQYKSKGLFIPAFGKSMQQIFAKNSPYRVITFCIESINHKMLTIADSMMFPMASKVNKQVEYHCDL